jgi:hypothetical protein
LQLIQQFYNVKRDLVLVSNCLDFLDQVKENDPENWKPVTFWSAFSRIKANNTYLCFK